MYGKTDHSDHKILELVPKGSDISICRDIENLIEQDPVQPTVM